jgi:hypothetical protein
MSIGKSSLSRHATLRQNHAGGNDRSRVATARHIHRTNQAFRTGLRDLGYRNGRDIHVEYRWADTEYDRLPALL